MAFSLADILPNTSQSLDGTCFIFGSGASTEAGYPMMPALTRQVIANLSAADRQMLDEILTALGVAYDDTAAKPNIEEIADFVIAHATNSGMATHRQLENKLRDLVVAELLQVKSPDLSNHIKFIEALRRRAFGLKCCVWIVTTNYDLLFEAAAARARVHVVNGFCGTTTRFFDPTVFDQVVGSVSSDRFTPASQLTIKLVKLHGSLSWFTDGPDGNSLFEIHPDAISSTAARVMVLPRRKKVIDTLAFPYDQIFSRTSRMIGAECRYLVSCGFSFGDDHINQSLVIPHLKAGRCRLTALCKEEPDGIGSFKDLPTFNAGFSDRSIQQGAHATATTDLWQFSKFVKLFE
jgi:hypothetical protein